MNLQLTFELLLLVIVYLFGSIPFSVLLGTKIKGVDVRKHGSGNPGGTNSIRWLGRPVGFTIVFLDGLKGGAVLLLVAFGIIHLEYLPPLLFGVVGASGHVFSIFMKFKGGKAVAATVGILVAYNIIWAVIAMIVFFSVIKISKYVSIGSTSVPIVILVLSTIYGILDISLLEYQKELPFLLYETPFFIYLLLLIVIRHRSNYKNIKNGIEPKVKWA